MDEKQRDAVKKTGMILSGKSKGLSINLLRWQNITIIVADDVPPSIFNRNKKSGKKTIVWGIKDTKDKERKDVPAIMDRIRRKVEILVQNVKEGGIK
jgi:hypothetical protein